MADLQVKDANGKEFTLNTSKICDINGDLGNGSSTSVTDSVNKNRVAKVHDIEYVDQNGQVIDNMQLLKDIASGKTTVVALDVEMEATHSGKNHNYCIYYEDSMEKDAESFVNPFKKPMLKNHNDYSGEPLGRITQSWFGPSALTDERSAIHLKARVTDQDAIPKFLDGRYGTVSIGGTMGTVTCNVCGKTILKDGKFKFCGHWRGESYKDQVCYWGAKDIEYHEVSTVNNPADDYAQIMKVTVVTDSSEKKDGKEETPMANTGKDSTQVDAAKKAVCDIIDQMLGKPAVADSTTTPDSTPATDGEEQKTDANDGQAQTDADVKDSQQTEELEKVKKELADSKEELAKVQKELEDSKAALEQTKKELEDSKAEADELKDKCMTLATANKELVADGIIAKELAAGKVKDEEKDARKEELLAMSMKDLNKLSEEEVVKDAAPRTPAQVTNPTLANPDKDNKDSNGTADTHKETTDSKEAKKTVDDFANDIVGKLFNKR